MVVPVDTKIEYSSDFSRNNRIVCAVNEQIISRSNLGEISFKADKQGVCFLCDGVQTYRIRLVENSNAQFVTETLANRTQIDSSFPGIVVLDPVHCRILPDSEIEAVFQKNSGLDDIVRIVSNDTIWSESRIMEHIGENALYFCDTGRWKRMSRNMFFSYMDVILKTCTILGKSGENPDRYNSEDVWTRVNDILRSESELDSDVGETFEELPLSFVQYLLSRLSPDESDVFKNKGESEWPLHIPVENLKVVQLRAHQLLNSRFGQNNRVAINMSKFVNDLRDILTTTASVDPQLLHHSDGNHLESLVPSLIEGVATVDGDLIVPFDASNLSIDLDKRITELFKIKSRWTKGEFETFISAILAPETKPESVLIKSCRIEQDEDGTTYYSSKF